MDIKKYFPHINHEILKNMFLHKFKDKDLLWLINDIIDSMPDNIGIPIGNYTSQYFANFYLSKFIHWLKEVKHVKFVDVYMDDIIILHSDKTYLHQLHLDCEQYLKQELKLDIKDNWQIYLVDVRGIDFVGYKFYHDHIALRKSTKIRMERKINGYVKFYNKFKYLDHSTYCSINSYAGFLLFGDCKNLYKKYITNNGFDCLIKRKDGNYIIKNKKRGQRQ